MPIQGPPLEGPVSLTTLLQKGLASNPDATALVSSAMNRSWRDLDETSDRLATGLLALGLQPGDRVASLMPNRVDLLVHYLACFKAGLVATPLNYRYQPPEIDHALGVSGASVLMAHAEREADVAASKLAPKLRNGVIGYANKSSKGVTFEQLTDPGQKSRKHPTPDSSAPAIIFFTSGSTGLPKGVTHTMETFGWVVASSRSGLRLTDKDVMLPGSSHSHVGGITMSMAALAAGARVVIPRAVDSQELLHLFRNQRPTVLWMLPSALFGLVRDHGAGRDDFQSLRLCIAGGDKVPGELEREFIDLTRMPIREGYGMTEIGHATNNPPDGVEKVGSIGPLNPGYSLSIRDDQGAELPVGAEGRLWIKSPCNMKGYWDNPKATADTIRDGWLDTGDLMRVDSDGYLWFGGRKKQIIVHDGSNICPQEVEAALLDHPSIASAAVVGVHDLVHGEIVVAYVVLQPNTAEPKSQDLIDFARKQVGYKAPEIIAILPQMPMNATGKVDRMTLKRLAEERFGHAK